MTSKNTDKKTSQVLDIVFLDSKTIGKVSNLALLSKQGKVEYFDNTSADEVLERCKGKDVIITNKVNISRSIIEALPSLKLICVTATGVKNVDTEYAEKKGVIVKNVAGYSTESVAQVTFAMLFYLLNKLSYYDSYVKSGKYSRSDIFTNFDKQFWELSGKMMGIIGLGTIGIKVAQIAQAFKMKVAFYSTTGKNNNVNFKRFDLQTLLRKSDVVSIHAPLTDQTRDLINYEKLKLMKSCAILLNTGRGGIINEKDLARALDENILAAAGLDVLENEPIKADNPLLKIYDKEKILISPHMAWTSIEARERLIEQTAKNIEQFRSGME